MPGLVTGSLTRDLSMFMYPSDSKFGANRETIQMMDFSNIDGLLFLITFVGHVTLLIILLRKDLYKEFPIFTAYVFFSMIEDPLLLLSMQILHVPPAQWTASPIYFRVFYSLKVPESLLGFGVLFEIARSVLQPVKRSLPRASLVLFGILLLIGGSVTYLLSGHGDPATLLSRIGSIFIKISLVSAALRIVCFLLIAMFAQVLGIGWKNHVLQLATGLAFYASIDLIVKLAHERLASGGNLGVYYTQFRLLDELRVIGYLSTVTFWCWSFARKEALRKEFSPQMARLLVSIAGAVKKDRSHFTS